MNLDDHSLVRALVDPRGLTCWTAHQWDALLPLARRAGILAQIAARLDEMGLMGQLHPKVRDQLQAAGVVAAERSRIIRWEVNRISRALAGIDTPIVLLKGAAYTMANLPLARGRLSCDVDILVRGDRIDAVERALVAGGWEPVKLDPYDQHYYRTWMHELPPLQHSKRQTVIDVHHTILPKTGRLSPNPQRLLADSRPVDGSPAVRVLAPADMVLHSAAHLFQDGDMADGLRDLADLDNLLTYYGQVPTFWDELVLRARQLNLQRPLYYCLRYTQRVLGTLVPAGVTADAPVRPVPWIMDLLVERALVGAGPGRPHWGLGWARWVLYVRSHWLKMPPPLLARHLLRKLLTKRQTTASGRQ